MVQTQNLVGPACPPADPVQSAPVIAGAGGWELRRAKQSSARKAWLLRGACALLFAVNAARLFRHALWRDEVQAWVIAHVTATPWGLFHNLRYEGHPGLWYLLLWIASRFTTDPAAMQFVQFAIAAGFWYLVYRYAPFSAIEKLLLLLSYFLFWEYFVLSREYGLMVLFGFGYIALRARAPERVVAPWVVLALLANTDVFGAIWSIGLAATLALAQIAATRTLLRGTAIGGLVYLGGFALAVATMMPAADGNFRVPIEVFYAMRAAVVIDNTVTDAFVPISGNLLTHPARAFSGNADYFWNPRFDYVGGMAWMEIVLIAIIAAAVLACGVMARKRSIAVIEPIGAVIATFVGSITFSYIWQTSASRHAGVLFLALTGALWLLRARQGGTAPRWWIALLAVNALGGLITLQSEFRPFSQAEATAVWLKQNGLARAFIMSAEDAQVGIVGYLDRPIYDLGCQCSRDFIRWNHTHQIGLDNAVLTRRIDRVVGRTAGGEILVLDHPFVPAAGAQFDARLMHAFTGAAFDKGNFYVYRVTGDDRPAGRAAGSRADAPAMAAP